MFVTTGRYAAGFSAGAHLPASCRRRLWPPRSALICRKRPHATAVRRATARHAHDPPGPHRRRADLRPARPGRTVTAPLLHGLAVVWRSRLSERLRNDPAYTG